MYAHPLNLALRFLLELLALYIFGAWGWQRGEGAWRWVLVLGLPLIAAAIWGIFRVPGDPGPAPVPVPGILRLLIEFAFFGLAVWMLYDLGKERWSWITGAVLVFHYILSYDRVGQLLSE